MKNPMRGHLPTVDHIDYIYILTNVLQALHLEVCDAHAFHPNIIFSSNLSKIENS